MLHFAKAKNLRNHLDNDLKKTFLVRMAVLSSCKWQNDEVKYILHRRTNCSYAINSYK